MKKILYFSLITIGLVSCKLDGRFLTTATGSIYECLIVCDKSVSDSVQATMSEYMYGLPQSEPTFVVSHVTYDRFDNYLKATRNILQIDIDASQYTKVSVATTRDVWSKPQAYVRIKAPTVDEFLSYWSENGEAIREWFIREELSRQIRLYKGTKSEKALAILSRKKYQMALMSDYPLIEDTVIKNANRDIDVVWCCNNKGPMRKDILIYTYPYTAQSQFSNDSIIAMRNEVVGRLVSAQVPGSYMTTECNYFPPVSRSVMALNDSTGGFYAIETRGLWKIKDGEAMGGPFVSLTRLDQVNGLVVHAEAFIFAPNQRKRTALRQMEAMLYTLKLPNEK